MAFTREKAQLMSASEIDRTLVRLAHEILEKTEDLSRLAFIGIRRRGVPLAMRLAEKIKNLEKLTIPVGLLDINLYRDDLSTVSEKPVHSATEINFPITGKDIILMDDVLYTGRTIRAALDALFDQGRPSRVQLLVLIDRGWRELPIEARYVGRMVQTSANEIIEVKFKKWIRWRRCCSWKKRRTHAGRIAGNRIARPRRDRSHPRPGEAFSTAVVREQAAGELAGRAARADDRKPVLRSFYPYPNQL